MDTTPTPQATPQTTPPDEPPPAPPLEGRRGRERRRRGDDRRDGRGNEPRSKAIDRRGRGSGQQTLIINNNF